MFKETAHTSHSFKQTYVEPEASETFPRSSDRVKYAPAIKFSPSDVWVLWWEGEFCEDGHELKAVFQTKESAIGWLHKNNPTAARVGIEDDCLEYQEKLKFGFRFWYIKKFEIKN